MFSSRMTILALSAAVAMTLLLWGITAGASSQRIQREESAAIAKLAGAYYRGDGTGFNLYLSLNRDGTFHCVLRGCLGPYGEARGRWVVSGNTIDVEVEFADGQLGRRPLSDLEVSEHDGETILIQLNDRELYDEYGPDKRTCFWRVSTLEAQDWQVNE